MGIKNSQGANGARQQKKRQLTPANSRQAALSLSINNKYFIKCFKKQICAGSGEEFFQCRAPSFFTTQSQDNSKTPRKLAYIKNFLKTAWPFNIKSGVFLFSVLISISFVFSGCSYFKTKKTNDLITVSQATAILESGYYDENVYFAIDSYDIEIEARNSLMRLARIAAISKAKISLDGHADKTGEKSHNMELSQNRAGSVKQYFMSLGINEEDIKTRFFGDLKPLIDDETPEAYAKNRRVEITLHKEPDNNGGE
jgi:flagellar motor protein MotB